MIEVFISGTPGLDGWRCAGAGARWNNVRSPWAAGNAAASASSCNSERLRPSFL